jgi:hypothetical protein
MQDILGSKDGFALPSVLFLITILSLVILSILTLKYIHRQSALLDVARVKADYAAMNGINRTLAELNSTDLPKCGEELKREYDFGTQGSAAIQIQRWGMYTVLVANGRIGRISSERVALVAGHPSKQFDNALVFANNHHQLVLTGTTKIIGDVVTGQNGITLGTLRDLQTPRTIPVEGKIKKENTFSISLQKWRNTVEDLKKHLSNNYTNAPDQEAIVRLSSPEGMDSQSSQVLLNNSTLTEQTRYVIVDGNLLIKGKIVRRTLPLSIIVKGNIEFQQDASILGLIAIYSTKSINIPSKVSIESAILFSQTSIDLKENARISAQLFAPSIEVASLAMLSYPAMILSFPSKDPKTIKQEILLANGSYIEGTVAMLAGSSEEDKSVINIQSGSKVVGAVVSEGYLTLDGSVLGTVITKDFYFYEDPTTYLGWIRTGRIERAALSPAFLIPSGFAESDRLDVLDWL